MVIADGQYTLTRLLHQGGYSSIYFAEVDLNRFDFQLLLDTHESRGKSTERRRKPASGVGEPDSPAGMCRRLMLPYPRDLRAAVKVMSDDRPAQRQKRFEAEWQKMIALYHLHLMSVYGAGQSDGLCWYAMEALPQVKTLPELYALPAGELLELGAQAAGGLGVLHKNRQIHGDLRPDKLLSFGRPGKPLLRVVQPVGGRHVGGGTRHYLSPEQIQGRRVDQRTDVYSLGAALYRLLSGHVPYEGCEADEIEELIEDGKGPTPAGKLNTELAQATQQLLRKMMAMDPARRLQSMGEVQDAIRGILSDNRYAVSQLLDPKRGATTQRRERNISSVVRKPATPPLQVVAMVAAAIIGVLVLGFMISALTGGKGGPRETEEWGKVSEKTPDGVKEPPGTAADGDDRLIGRLGGLGKRAVVLAQQGQLAKAQELQDELTELAMSREDSDQVAQEFSRWQDKIGIARTKYLDSVAIRAAKALKEGQKAQARRLIQELEEHAPSHVKLPDLLEELEK